MKAFFPIQGVSYGIVASVFFFLSTCFAMEEGGVEVSGSEFHYDELTAVLFDTSGLHYYSFQEKVSVDYKEYAKDALIPVREVCAGGSLTVSAPDHGSQASYQWSGPNGFRKSGKDLNFTNISTSNEGVYAVEIQVGEELVRGSVRVTVHEIAETEVIMPENMQPNVMHLQAVPLDPQASYTWIDDKGVVMSRSADFYVSRETARNAQFRLEVVKKGCSVKLPVEINLQISATRRSENILPRG